MRSSSNHNNRPQAFPVEIVSGGIKHADKVIEIVSSALRSFGIEPSPDKWDAEIFSFGRNPPDVCEFVAQSNEQVIGVVVLKEPGNGHGMLRDLYVDEDYRGQGVGRLLLDHIIRVARINGLSRLELETRTEFEAAISLYESTGWKRGPDLKQLGDPPIGPDRTYYLPL